MRSKTLFTMFGWTLFSAAVAVCAGCENGASPASSSSSTSSTASLAVASIPAASPISAEAAAGDSAIRFLEDRVKKDPDDFIALNKLAGYYQLKLRETGNLQWLALTRRTAEASLKAIPAEQNTGGLTLLAQAEFAQHNFAAARDHAKRLIELDGRKAYPYQMLGDALLELGDYDGADKAFYEMEQRGRQTYTVETRLGRLAMLRGKDAQAKTHFTNALLLALEMVPKQRETVAWTRRQLGELAFNAGNYAEAEKHYRDALITFPDYYQALAGLGRARAAQGDLNAAIENYERAVKLLPDPVFVAALGDLYELAGRKPEAAAQFTLCEKLAALGNVYDRQLALFYADHDLKPEEAYNIAKREYEARKDIYGADALAWAALKAKRLDEARQLSKEALRLGTQDARLLYHAGLIARAAGDKAAARDLLQRALKLNPQFDPRHAPIAGRALAE